MKGLRKRLMILLSMVVCLSMVFGGASMAFADEEVDSTATDGVVATDSSTTEEEAAPGTAEAQPGVLDIIVSPKEVKPGDTLTVTVIFANPDDFEFALIDYDYTNDESATIMLDDNFVGEELIDNKITNGEHQLTQLFVGRPNGDAFDFDISEFDTTFTVTGSAEDSEPPMGTATINDKEFLPGDAIIVNADLTDDVKLGGANVYVRQITNPDEEDEYLRYEGGAGVMTSLYPDPDVEELGKSQHFTETIEITNGWVNGDYDVIVEGYDEVSNMTLIDKWTVTIKDSLEDTYPPEVSDVTIDKTEVKPGDVITVTAKVYENGGSDILNVYADFDTEEIKGNTQTVYGYGVEMEPVEGSENEYIGTIEVDDTWLNRAYVLTVSATDTVENSVHSTQEDKIVTVTGSKELDPEEIPDEPSVEPTDKPEEPKDNNKPTPSKDDSKTDTKTDTKADSKEDAKSTDNSKASGTTNAPKTGDEEAMIMWIVIVAMSLMATSTAVIARGKNSRL